jgi:hypothetical protein
MFSMTAIPGAAAPTDQAARYWIALGVRANS